MNNQLWDLAIAERKRRVNRERLGGTVEKIIEEAMRDPRSTSGLRRSLGDLLALCDAFNISGPAVDFARALLREACST